MRTGTGEGKVCPGLYWPRFCPTKMSDLQTVSERDILPLNNQHGHAKQDSPPSRRGSGWCGRYRDGNCSSTRKWKGPGSGRQLSGKPRDLLIDSQERGPRSALTASGRQSERLCGVICQVRCTLRASRQRSPCRWPDTDCWISPLDLQRRSRRYDQRDRCV